MILIKYVNILFLLILFFLLHSCAAFRSSKFDSLKLNKTPLEKEVSVVYTVSYYTSENDGLATIDPEQRFQVMQIIQEHMRETASFDFQSTHPSYRLDFRYHQHIEYSPFLTWLSGLTLTVFPSRLIYHYCLRADVVDRLGKVVHTAHECDSLYEWRQMLLVFWVPFKAPMRKIDEVVNDVTETTVRSVVDYFRSVTP